MKKAFGKVIGSLAGLVIGTALIYLGVIAVIAVVSGAGFVQAAQNSGTWLVRLFQK